MFEDESAFDDASSSSDESGSDCECLTSLRQKLLSSVTRDLGADILA